MNISEMRQACTLPNICRLFALLLVVWQPMPGEFRVPLIGLVLLGLVIMQRKQLDAIAEPVWRLGQLLACLLVPGLLSIPTSLAPGKSWTLIALVGLAGLVGISLLYGLQRLQDHRWLQKGILITITAWVGDALWQAASGADLFRNIPPEGFVTGPFEPNAIFGIILVNLLPLAFWQPLKQRKRWSYPLLGLALIVITLTGQRNNLILAIVAIICLSSLWRSGARLKVAAIFTCLLIATIPFSTALHERAGTMAEAVAEQNYLTSTSQRIQSKAEDPKELLFTLNKLSTDRGYIFEAGFNMIRHNPITGAGIGAFRKAYPQFTSEVPARQNIHPHHIYLGIAAETGLIGIIFFIYAIYLGWFWFSTADQERKKIATPYASSLIVLLFPLATHTSLFRTFHFSVFILILCGFISALFAPASLSKDINPSANLDFSYP